MRQICPNWQARHPDRARPKKLPAADAQQAECAVPAHGDVRQPVAAALHRAVGRRCGAADPGFYIRSPFQRVLMSTFVESIFVILLGIRLQLGYESIA